MLLQLGDGLTLINIDFMVLALQFYSCVAGIHLGFTNKQPSRGENIALVFPTLVSK